MQEVFSSGEENFGGRITFLFKLGNYIIEDFVRLVKKIFSNQIISDRSGRMARPDNRLAITLRHESQTSSVSFLHMSRLKVSFIGYIYIIAEEALLVKKFLPRAKVFLEIRVGFAPTYNSFAGYSLATWVPNHMEEGVGFEPTENFTSRRFSRA